MNQIIGAIALCAATAFLFNGLDLWEDTRDLQRENRELMERIEELEQTTEAYRQGVIESN